MIHDYTLPFGRGDVFTLIWTGDWHEGAVGCYRKGIDAMIDRAHRPRAAVIVGGDYADFITPKDRRFDVSEDEHRDPKTKTVLQQLQVSEDRFKELRDVCIGAIESNHDGYISKDLGSITRYLCEKSKVPYLGQVVAIRLHCPGGVCKVMASHYLPSMRSQRDDPLASYIYRMGRLRRVLSLFEADLKLGAHIHRFLASPPVSQKRMTMDGAEWERKAVPVYKAWHVVCPSMMRTYKHPNYAQARLADPTDIGWAEIDLDRRGRVVETRHVLPDGTVEQRQTGAILVD